MTDEISIPRLCLNCGEPVAQNFCPNCGQEVTTMIVPVGHLMRDVLDQFLLLDSKLLRTLKLLLTRPGFLTNEYIAGRRARYLSPFRLYFIISALYFLAFSFAHYDVTVMHGLGYALEQTHPAHSMQEEAPSKITSDPMAAESHSLHPMAADSHSLQSMTADSHSLHHGGAMSAVPDRARRHHLAVERTSDWFLKNQSLITFLLVPIAALLLKILTLGTRRLYIEHLVFAVHLQSFLFLLLLPALLPYGRNLTYILAFVFSTLYLFAAMRTVYRLSVAATLARCGVMLAAYLVIMSATAFAAFLLFYSLA